MNEQQVKEIAELAAAEAIKVFHKTKEAAQKEEKSKRLRNTKLLMKSYNELKEYVERVDVQVKARATVPKISVDSNENIIDLIQFGTDVVKSIKSSTQATIVMIQHIDRALDALEYIYKKENDIASYKVFIKRYISKMTIEQLAELHNMSRRTVYNTLDKVLERLSVLLFGVYAIKVI